MKWLKRILINSLLHILKMFVKVHWSILINIEMYSMLLFIINLILHNRFPIPSSCEIILISRGQHFAVPHLETLWDICLSVPGLLSSIMSSRFIHVATNYNFVLLYSIVDLNTKVRYHLIPSRMIIAKR